MFTMNVIHLRIVHNWIYKLFISNEFKSVGLKTCQISKVIVFTNRICCCLLRRHLYIGVPCMKIFIRYAPAHICPNVNNLLMENPYFKIVWCSLSNCKAFGNI